MSPGSPTKRRVLLVGAFRSIVPEILESPYGSQGGFVDALAPEPYSLANGCLKAFVEADPDLGPRLEVDLLDLAEPLHLEDSREEVALTDDDVRRILAFEPDVVALSSYCWNLDTMRWLASEIGRRRPATLVLLGGRSAHGDPEGLLAETPGLDGVVVGEGELPFRQLLGRADLDLSGIAGVVHRTADGVASGGPPRSLDRLDDIPSPYLTGVLEPPRNGVMLELGRGCPNDCGYCSWNADKRLRAFSPERIGAEVAWALERGHRHITLNDSAINYDEEHLSEVVAAIRRADPDGRVRFTYNLRHELVTEGVLEALAPLRTHMVLLGVESLGAPAMAEVDREPVDTKELRRTLSALSRAVRPPVVSIVLGLPGDTEEGFAETLQTLLSWTAPPPGEGPPAVGTVLVSLLQVYRGSPLWRRREELGLQVAERGIPYLIESPSWSLEALARAKADLVRRMSEGTEALKAAEAIVLMEAHGGLDPWLRPERIEALLEGWPEGERRGGWTLEASGVMRDTGRGVLLRFLHVDGAARRVLLRRRPQRDRGPFDSRLFALSVRPGGTGEGDDQALLVLVRDVLLDGEARLAARAAAR